MADLEKGFEICGFRQLGRGWGRREVGVAKKGWEYCGLTAPLSSRGLRGMEPHSSQDSRRPCSQPQGRASGISPPHAGNPGLAEGEASISTPTSPLTLRVPQHPCPQLLSPLLASPNLHSGKRKPSTALSVCRGFCSLPRNQLTVAAVTLVPLRIRGGSRVS